jgi:uncharacterized protein DUF2510
MEDDRGAGWRPDPTARHQLRYHDGTTFTDHVADNGIVGVDGYEAIRNPVATGMNPALPGAPLENQWPTATWPAPQQQTPFGGNRPSPYSGQFWPGTAAAPLGKRRRVGLVLVIVVAVLEGIAIVALSVALVAAKSTSSQPIGSIVSSSGSFNRSEGDIVYSSNFGSGQNWPTGSLNANTTASMTDGQYVVQGWTSIHHLLLAPYSVPHSAISVEAVATDFSSDQVSMGVGCQSGSGVQPPLAYQLVVYPDGQWYIEEARIPGAVEPLTSGDTSALGTTGTLQLTCAITNTTSDKETMQLVAYVNGTRVGSIGDQIGRPFVGGYIPVLVLGSFGPKVHAAFTGITVRSINR